MSSGPSSVPTARGLEAQTLTQRDRELVKLYLGNPLEFPAIFKGWLETYLDPLVREIVGTAIGRIPDPPTPFAPSYALLADQKAQATAGGTFTSGAWQTRVLNTEVSDVGNIISLASNQFTLQAGTYLVLARAPAHHVDRHQTRLQNISDAVTVVMGSSMYASATAGVENDSTVQALLTLAAAKAFELQHRCATTEATDGFGVEANLATEVYAQVQIVKIA